MRNPADRLTLYGERNVPSREPAGVDDAAFDEVLRDAITAVEADGLPYLLMGGIASGMLGRPRWTHDVDFLVKPEHAAPVLQTLARAGFTTEATDPVWPYKAFSRAVLVDMIRYGERPIYPAEAMPPQSLVW